MKMQEVSVFSLFKIARKKAVPLVLTLVIAATVAFVYCSVIATPIYGAEVSLIVTNGVAVASDSATSSQKVLSSDVQASLLLADSIVDILDTNDVYKRLSNRLKRDSHGEIDYSYSLLKANTTVARRGDDTLFIDITYTDSDGERAVTIANTFADTACEYIKDIPGLIGRSDPSSVSTADKAKLVSPRTLRNTVLVAFGATFILYCFFILVELLNNTVNGEEDFTSRYDIPLLGSVPDFEEARKASSDGKGRYY